MHAYQAIVYKNVIWNKSVMNRPILWTQKRLDETLIYYILDRYKISMHLYCKYLKATTYFFLIL